MDTTANLDLAQAFIARWQGVTASELATAQSFTAELCELLSVAKPHPTPDQDYMFERPVTFAHGDGSTSAGRIDCYRRGHFVLEAKKLKAAGHTKGFDDALLRARAQAEGYARALPVAEGRPPFLMVVDVGNVIEVYAEFSRSGATYTPFPDPRSHRIALADLAKPDILARLHAIWTAPDSLNPAHASARVTREVSLQLATLAKSLEAAGHKPELVAAFLTRCLFSMFAEDVELLPKNSFLGLLQAHRDDSDTLSNMLRVLWADMDRGGFSAALAKPVLRFNGKLFKEPAQDGYVLPLSPAQVDHLITAARANWREVEPAIFGTLLERALSPTERHALGAHYTPRAYVERLVLPTVMEPLRADWANAQAAAVLLAGEGKMKEACAEVRRFHHQLCTTRVLDPACGSGNFLYVTLEHLKRLEGEVLNQLAELGETQDKLGFEGETVTLQQLRGIELNERAAALAELVLWIGFLQWHIRTRGNQAVAEPVVHDYGNIECRDAVLAWDAQEPMRDATGAVVSRWDGTTFKTHPVTGAQVPDEAAQVPQWTYLSPRKAVWPDADFVVGNPPFIGKLKMRESLGDGYVEALRSTSPLVPDSADLVMYWWHHAADLVANGKLRRLGLITTNSIWMTYNRRVVQYALDKRVNLALAIADHPWVDSANGAAVRIAMTVADRFDGQGLLLTVTDERPGADGEVEVSLKGQVGKIHADLKIGVDLSAAVPLLANNKLSTTGVIPHGEHMVIMPADAGRLEPDAPIRPYRNGKDLTDRPRAALVIDCYGLTAGEVRSRYPSLYQWLHDRVKPERDANRDPDLREKWWLHRRNNEDMRKSLAGLQRYIATTMTAKHRVFQFLDGAILPDQMLVVVASQEALLLGVLSSGVHCLWAMTQGSTLEDRPRYIKSRCFETFPFPDEDTGLTPTLRDKIAVLAEQIDAHRKRQQAAHTGVTLTGMYNVLEAVREGRALTAKEQAIHVQGLVSVLKELHDELDAAVLEAYGWPTDLDRDGLLTQLVTLNAQRAAEERAGKVRWLRPEFQNPAQASAAPAAEQRVQVQHGLAVEVPDAAEVTGAPVAKASTPWPASLPEQVRAVADVLAGAGGPVAVSGLEASFKGRGPWKKSLPRILDTLEALGRARRVGADNWVDVARG